MKITKSPPLPRQQQKKHWRSENSGKLAVQQYRDGFWSRPTHGISRSTSSQSRLSQTNASLIGGRVNIGKSNGQYADSCFQPHLGVSC